DSRNVRLVLRHVTINRDLCLERRNDTTLDVAVDRLKRNLDALDAVARRGNDLRRGRTGVPQAVRNLVRLQRRERTGQLEVAPTGTEQHATPTVMVGRFLLAALRETVVTVEDADKLPLGAERRVNVRRVRSARVKRDVNVCVCPQPRVTWVSSHTGCLLSLKLGASERPRQVVECAAVSTARCRVSA